MSEHSPASTSQFTSTRGEPVGRQPVNSAETLTRQASQAGEHVVRNVQDYPFGAIVVAGLVGYGIGYLIHRSRSSEPWEQSYPDGPSGNTLRPLE